MYEYDNLGQLIREDNTVTNKTYTYLYDNAGNIQIKSTHDLTPEGQTPNTYRKNQYYSYTDSVWGDRITNSDGHDVIYDAIGNPLTYFNGYSYTFTWNGRQLASAVLNGTTSSYVYDADGLRTQKTVGTTVYDYYWNNGKLYGMTITNGSEVNELMFAYDSEGTAFAMSYNGTVYYYLTDIKDNVNGLID